MLLRTAVRRFEEGYFSTCERSEKTRAAYLCDLGQFCEFYGPRRKLAAVGCEAIEGWARHLKAAGYEPASMKRKMASLRVFLLYWVRRGLLEQSPFWRVRLSLGRSRKLPRCLTEAETRALLGKAEEASDGVVPSEINSPSRPYQALRNFALVDLLFVTGLRVGEAVSVDLDDLQMRERTLRVRGKGGRMRLAFLTEARSLAIQTAHLEARSALLVATPALFVNRLGGRLSTQGVANAVSKLGKTASLRRRVTPHMLRHTVATLLLKNGVDLRIVQEFLGHSSITTTERYTYVDKKQLVGALRKGHPARRLRTTQ